MNIDSNTTTNLLSQVTNVFSCCCLWFSAGPSLRAYNYDSPYGKRALAEFYDRIVNQVSGTSVYCIIFVSYIMLFPPVLVGVLAISVGKI